MIARLGDLGRIITGNTPKTSDAKNYEAKDICFVKPSDIDEHELTYIKNSECYVAEYARGKARIVPIGSVLVTCIGIIGKVGINDVKCAFNQQINAVIPNASICNNKYLAYAIQSSKSRLEHIANAPVVPILNKSQFSDIEIPLPSLDEQRKIAAVLDKISDLTAKRRRQLDKLDELVKSRFVEMFGDPVCNRYGLPLMPMTDLCTIIDGDRGVNYPKQEDFSGEGYCLFLNAKNVTSNGFSFDSCMFISKEKDDLLRAGKLSRGDVVLTTRGTVGNLAFYDDSVDYDNIRINSGMVILRMKRDIVSEQFFIEQFKMQLQVIKTKIANGSAQPQLPISTMNKIMMIVPSLNLQKHFGIFVVKINKEKLKIQHSLASLDTLKKSLMQEYFLMR